jgi:ribosomal protein S18 acetylase RimI-like enzyme
MPEIETALPSDGRSILEITAKVGIFNPTELSCVDELWCAYQDSGEASGYAFLVYRQDGGQAGGYVCFGPHSLTQGTYDLYWIAVDPALQGHGVGRALLSRAEAEVRERGGRLMLIETSTMADYAPACRLYAACDFRLEATVHDFYAPGDHLLIWAKAVNGAQAALKS